MAGLVPAPNPWATDALWPGAMLLQRLKEELPDLREVLAVDEVDPKAAALKQYPGAMVLCDSLVPVGSTGHAGITRCDQAWLVVLAVQPARREPARSVVQLGPLISATVRAVHGWSPQPNKLQPFTWERGPRPRYGAVTLFPLLFRLGGVTTR
jgi:hypothetical protein